MGKGEESVEGSRTGEKISGEGRRNEGRRKKLGKCLEVA